MKREIAIGIGAITLLGAYTISNLGATTVPYTAIQWDKPTTDAGWAEDVKRENFDIKSTGVLETMIESHTAKLEREIVAFKKYQECPECIYYEFYEGFIQSGYTEQDAQAEAAKQRDEAIANRAWSIEKLRQSVERMNKEVELRQKGFLVVELGGEYFNADGQMHTMLGASLPPERIRHIHD